MVKISVIIPAKNEQEYIEDCLKSFSNQTFKDYELIVVDGLSKDMTNKIAKKYAKIVKQDGVGVSNARNCGARHAKGKILVFADADVRVGRNFLKRVWEEFSNPLLGGIVPRINVYDARKKSIKIAYSILEKLISLYIKIGYGSTIGSCFIFDRKTFFEMGGFDESLLTIEDTDMVKRVSKMKKVKKSDIVVSISARRVNKQGLFKSFRKSFIAYMLYSLNHTSYPPYWALD